MKSRQAPAWIGRLGEVLNPGLGLVIDLYYWLRKRAKLYVGNHIAKK